MSTTDESLSQLVEIAEEQLRWLRASVLPDVRRTIETTLSTTQLRRAYEMCDGTNTGQAIATAVGGSQQTLSRWTRRWRDVGIAYDTREGRIKHLVSLAALGVPLEVDAT
jgi:DNA-binding transcriptional ArsR family regulator